MSREIKFRGKQINKGEWIIGQYIKDKEREGTSLSEFAHKIQPFYEQAFAQPVIPETIGQYIGVPDKNGKEIYEGDIVKQFADCTELGKSLYFFYIIEWDNEYCAFVGREIYSNEVYLMPDLEDIEVIGNAYENADLLKETGNE